MKPLGVIVLASLGEALPHVPQAACGGRDEVLDLLGVCVSLQLDDRLAELTG